MSEKFRATGVLILTMALLVGPSSAAFAQTDEPTREELDRAGEHFQRGAENYAAGEYSKAVVDFLKAYNEVPNALFLYNISLSYGKLGNVEDALAAARKAKAGTGMDDKTANRNEARIAAYERWTSATEIAADIERAKKARAAADMTDQTTVEVTAETSPPPRKKFGAVGWVGVGLMVVGGGLGATSAVVANGLKQPIEDYKRAGEEGDAQTYDELQSEIRSDQALGQALLFAGSGAAAAGLVLVLIDLSNGPGENASAILSPTADGGAIVGVRTRF